MDDVSGNYPSFQIPSGDLYLAVKNAHSNPVNATFYSKSETLNCLERATDNLTHIGNNRYRDTSNEAMTMTANGNSLAMTLSDEGLTIRINMEKSSVSEASLQVCGTQSDDGSALQDDQPSASLYEQLIKYSDRF